MNEFAIIREYDPRLELWFIDRVRPVVRQTEKSICIKESWFRKRWYSKGSAGIRFEVFNE